MSSQTTNLLLVKPTEAELVDVTVINGNMDAIDAAVSARGVYATCSTGASTAAKVASATGFSLVKGAIVYVHFTNANTAANATLNVNSTGAKAIYNNDSTTAANLSWVAGETVPFVYDGTCWRMVNSAGLVALRDSVSPTWGAIVNTDIPGIITRNKANYVSFNWEGSRIVIYVDNTQIGRLVVD